MYGIIIMELLQIEKFLLHMQGYKRCRRKLSETKFCCHLTIALYQNRIWCFMKYYITAVCCKIMELANFKYDEYNVIYPRAYFQFLKEVFVLDVYRSSLINKNDIVLDLGACTGDFCIIASKKVGPNGVVIALEPDSDNYELLKFNVKKNKCQNVIVFNVGVGKEDDQEKEIIAPFDKPSWGRISTLGTILKEIGIDKTINFIKMDIEGSEVDVIHTSIDTFKNADVISLEFHGTRSRIDELLLNRGFFFKPISMTYIYKRILRNLLLHPVTLFNVYVDTIFSNPHIVKKAFTGFDMTKDQLLVGSYIRAKNMDRFSR
jgi:FkbM family methyltransferase